MNMLQRNSAVAIAYFVYLLVLSGGLRQVVRRDLHLGYHLYFAAALGLIR